MEQDILPQSEGENTELMNYYVLLSCLNYMCGQAVGTASMSREIASSINPNENQSLSLGETSYLIVSNLRSNN